MLLKSLFHLFTPRARDEEESYSENYPESEKDTEYNSKVPSCLVLEFSSEVEIAVAYGQRNTSFKNLLDEDSYQATP
jgi:hypothetical protein